MNGESGYRVVRDDGVVALSGRMNFADLRSLSRQTASPRVQSSLPKLRLTTGLNGAVMQSAAIDMMITPIAVERRR
jgi:hypothetical protein